MAGHPGGGADGAVGDQEDSPAKAKVLGDGVNARGGPKLRCYTELDVHVDSRARVPAFRGAIPHDDRNWGADRRRPGRTPRRGPRLQTVEESETRGGRPAADDRHGSAPPTRLALPGTGARDARRRRARARWGGRAWRCEIVSEPTSGARGRRDRDRSRGHDLG